MGVGSICINLKTDEYNFYSHSTRSKCAPEYIVNNRTDPIANIKSSFLKKIKVFFFS